jgi:hypothetical protein
MHKIELLKEGGVVVTYPITGLTTSMSLRSYPSTCAWRSLRPPGGLSITPRLAREIN